MHRKKNYNFKIEQLDELVEDPSSCIFKNNTTYSLALYPYHLTNVSESVKRLLNLIIAKYDQRLDGILLGYKNLKLITPYASLRANSCYIHVDIQGDFFMFRPKVGSILNGIVNRISSDHIGCLVHKVFNVVVPNRNQDESGTNFNIDVRDILELCVTKLDLDGRLPYIRATIVSHTKGKRNTNNSTLNSTYDSPQKQKKKKHFNESSEVVDESLSQEAEETPNNSIKKQKKKRLSENETIQTSEAETPNLNESTKKRKKKRHSQTENNLQTNEETPNPSKSLKKQKNMQQSEQLENSENNIAPLSENKKQKKKRHSDKIDDVDIKLEELSQKTLILESQNLENKLNKTTPKKPIPNDSQRTNESDYFATPKIKKKQKHPENKKETPQKNHETLEKNPETLEKNLEKGSLEDFVPKEKKHKKRNSINDNTNTKTNSAKKKKNNEINIEELQKNLLMGQLKSLEPTKKEKKRKSKEKLEQKPIIPSPVKPMADMEDRKIKKRRQSLSQNVNWENKELHLYDSDLEKTLNTPTDNNMSLEFNLAKIQALNAHTPRKIKRKRKHETEDEFVHTTVVKKSKMEDY